METVGLSCPVTAVCVVDGPPHLIAAGFGRWLRLYAVDTPLPPTPHQVADRLLQGGGGGGGGGGGLPRARGVGELAVFPDTSRIHGIKRVVSKVDGGLRLICFGGKHVAVVDVSAADTATTPPETAAAAAAAPPSPTDQGASSAAAVGGSNAGPATAMAASCKLDCTATWLSPALDDLVLDAAFLTTNHGSNVGGVPPADSLALLLSHNQVELWRIGDSRPYRTVQGTDQCILYCGRLYGNTVDTLVATVGTISSVAVLWWPFSETTNAVCCFKGHQGAVFSARFDKGHRRLVTASDDRSVRVWRVPPTAVATTDRAVAVTLEVCDSEFVLYGHVSRVWDAVFIADHVVSVGEDAVCCVWSLADGQLLKRCIGHEGKNIWCVHGAEALGEVVCTGGADGAVRLWSVAADVALVEAETAVGLPDDLLGEPEDFPRLVALLALRSCVLATNNGDVVLQCGIGEPNPSFTVLDRAPGPGPRRFTCFEALPGVHAVACAGEPSGHVTLVSTTGAFSSVKWQAHERPLQAMFLQPRDDWAEVGGSACLFTVAPGVVRWWGLTGCGTAAPSVYPLGSFALDSSVTPSQSYVQCLHWCEDDSLLWTGDRMGTLTCFPAPFPTEMPPPSTASAGPTETAGSTSCAPPGSPALAVFRKLHGNKKSITYVAHRSRRVLVTASRDGYFREFVVGWTADGRTPTLRSVSKAKASAKLDWIVELVERQGSPQPVALGFEKDCFVAVDTASGEELCRVTCGGGHRSWSFLHRGDDVSLRTFVYLRDRTVRSTVVTAPSGLQKLGLPQVVQGPFSGREVLCALHIAPVEGPQGGDGFLVTGGEDCQVRISRNNAPHAASHAWSSAITQAGCPAQGHTSSIRCMCSVEMLVRGRTETVVFTAGGNGLLRCWVAVQHDGQLQLQRLSEWPPHGGSEDYRLMALVPLWNGGQLCLLVACSDGDLRLFTVGRDDCKLALVSSTGYHARCVLSLASVIACGHRLAFSGATDGRVAVWGFGLDVASAALPTLEVPVTTMAVHQSGVNSVAVAEEAPGRLVVVTGGDDNAITVGRWLCQDDDGHLRMTRVAQCSVVSAHASSVTDLELVSPLVFTSVSADCRLNVWRVTDGASGLVHNSVGAAGETELVGCSLVQSTVLDVDDPQSVTRVQQSESDAVSIVVTGCGMQILQLPSELHCAVPLS